MAAVFNLKEKSTGDLEVTISGEEWSNAVNKAFKKLANSITIPGFRKGKVPAKMLDKYVSENQRMVQAVEDNMNTWLIAGMQEAGVEPISRPDVNIKSMDATGATLVYTFQVMPEVKLGNYEGLDYKVKETTVTDEELAAEIDRMRKTYAENETVEGAAEEGDTVVIDYTGLKDGVEFEGGKAEGYSLKLGGKTFIPGFEDQLVGTKAGEDKDVNLTFPEDYFAEELKGAAVTFKVHVHEIKREVLPELNDDFAADVNIPGVENVEQLNAKVRERLEENKKNTAEREADEALVEEISKVSEVEIPEVLVQEEEQQMVNQMAGRVQQFGMNFNDYLKAMGKTVEELMKEYEENATKSVKVRLTLAEIAKKENLVPTDEQVEEEYQKIADQYQMDVAKVKEALQPEMIKSDLQNSMAFDFVKDKANKSVVKPEENSAE
jgi:trigger factor